LHEGDRLPRERSRAAEEPDRLGRVGAGGRSGKAGERRRESPVVPARAERVEDRSPAFRRSPRKEDRAEEGGRRVAPDGRERGQPAPALLHVGAGEERREAAPRLELPERARGSRGTDGEERVELREAALGGDGAESPRADGELGAHPGVEAKPGQAREEPGGP